MAKTIHQGAIMKSNLYLYGVESPVKVPQAVIDSRTHLLRQNMAIELSEPSMSRNYNKITAIVKAIDFWETINSVDLYEEEVELNEEVPTDED